MPSINEVYGSDELLKATDLPQGVNVQVTIESVLPKSFDDGGKLEMRFAGKKKGFICNKTNARTVADMHGEDFSFWPGKIIAIYRTFTDYQGRQVECLRVVPNYVPQQQATQQAPPQQPVNGGQGSPDF